MLAPRQTAEAEEVGTWQRLLGEPCQVVCEEGELPRQQCVGKKNHPTLHRTTGVRDGPQNIPSVQDFDDRSKDFYC